MATGPTKHRDYPFGEPPRSAVQAMAARPRRPEEWQALYRRWHDETEHLRKLAVELVATHTPLFTIGYTPEGKMLLDARMPPHVELQLAELSRLMVEHAIRLGLDVPPRSEP